jgi:gluconate 2-dehydrogenase gamma chain
VKRFERDWESQLFLRTLIAWTMEALLGDPVHGVNPEAKGWRWAHHRPGYPRPKPGWKPIGEGPAR